MNIKIFIMVDSSHISKPLIWYILNYIKIERYSWGWGYEIVRMEWCMAVVVGGDGVIISSPAAQSWFPLESGSFASFLSHFLDIP